MPERGPHAGEIYWMAAEKGHGREQSGTRPVLVVTDARLSSLHLAWVVPLTTTDRGWPLHVRVHIQGRVSVAMCEQLKSVSIERLGRLIGVITYQELAEVRSVIREIAS